MQLFSADTTMFFAYEHKKFPSKVAYNLPNLKNPHGVTYV